MKKLIALTLFIALAMTVLCCSALADQDTIIFAQGSDVTSLDPHIGKQQRAFTVHGQMFEQLVKFDENNEIVGVLAESWEILSATQTKFKIREGVKFHDGTELTAEDVAYSFTRLMNTAVSKNNVSFLESAEAISEYEVVLTTKYAYSPLLSALTSPVLSIVPKHAVEADPEAFALNPIGTGAYRFVEWKPDEYCLMERFDDYWGEKAKTKYVKMIVVPEASQRAIMLETGEIDVAYDLAPNDAVRMADVDGVQVLKTVSNKTIILYCNDSSEGPLGNPLVRRAIEMAIDKNLIVEVVLNNMATTANLGVPMSAVGYNADYATPKYDVDAAKALMAEAGYADGFELTLWCDDDQIYTEVCTVVQDMLTELNITVNIEIMSTSTKQTRLNEKQDFDMHISFFNNLINDVDYTFASTLVKDSASNYSYYDNPEVEALIDQSRACTDEEERQAIFDQIYEIIDRDCPSIPMYYESVIVGARSNISGFVPSRIGAHKYATVVK